MTPVFRQPDMAGPPVVFHYLRAEDGTRTPVAYSVNGGPWITTPALVEAVTNALFERDAIYARAMQTIAPHLPPPDEDGREVLATRRLDVDDAVVIGLSAVGLPEEDLLQIGAAISAALLAACADELAAGRLSAIWAG